MGIVGGNGLKIINSGNGTISGFNGTNAITFTAGQNTLSFANKTTSGIIGNIANNGTRLTLDQSSAVAVANVITGTGDVYKAGVGTLTLSGANSYSGRTNITGGTLSISADHNLGTAPVSTVAGKLTLGGTLETTATMTLNSNRLIELNQGAVIKVNTGTTTYHGVMSGVFGNNLTKSGPGTLLLGGNNTYTGVTSILGGTLQMGTANALAPTSGVKVNSADGKTVGLLDLNGNNQTLGSLEMVANDKLPGNINAVSGAGTLTLRGSISLINNTTASSAGGQTTIAGTRLDLGGATRTFNIASQGYNPEKTEADLTVSSIIQGGGVIIAGTPSTVNGTPATVHFTGANTYSGGTTIKKDSILFVNNNLGFGTGTVTVEAGGTAGIASGVTVTNTFVLNGSGAGIGTPNAQKGAFVVYGAPGTAVMTSMLTLNADGKISTPGGNTLQLNGGVNKTGVTATFTGGGTINVGTIGGGQTGISGGASGTFNSDMVLDGAGTGGTGLGDGVTVLNLNVASNYSGPTTITNGGVLNANVIGALPSLAADGGIAPSRTLVIMDPSGAVPGSAATFPSTGGSVLNLGAGNPGVGVANQALQSLTGATSSIVNLGGNTLTIGTASGTTEFAGVINGPSGGIIKDGASTQVLSGANTYTGTTVVQGGILQIGNGTAGNLNGASAVTVNSGSTLDINLGNSQTFTNGILNNGTVRGTNTGGTTVTQTVSGVISGSGNFVQNGGAATIFSNLNTYQGGTTVSGPGSQLTLGTLSSAASAGSGAISIDNGGILNLANLSENVLSRNILNGVGGVGTVSVNSSMTNTLSGLLSDGAAGTLALTQGGLGTTILTNNQSYTGQTNINAGTLQLGEAGVGGGLSGASNIINNGILDFQGANATPYTNVISGSGAIAKGQTNTLTLSGANSYEGLTTINTGTLVVGNASALGSAVGGTVVKSGTTLNLNGFNIGNEGIEIQGTGVGGLGALVNTSSSAAIAGGAVTMLGNTTIGTSAGRLTLNGVVSGGYNLTKVGSGTLFLNGVNDLTGQTFIDAGILAVGNASALGNTTAGTTVKDGASLMIGNGISTNSEPLTISGAGGSAVVDFLVTPGALTQALNGSSTVNGSVRLVGNSTISTNGTGTLTLNGTINKTAAALTLTGGGTIDINNVISGITQSFNSDLVVNGATANLNAANTYLGPTFITSIVAGDGVLNANVANALPTVGGRTSITMDASGAGSSVLNIGGSSLLLTGADQAIASLQGVTSSKVTLGGKTLTIGFGQGLNTFGTSNADFAGVISGTGSLVKDQTSTQILSGTNTFTGPVSVNGGTLSLQNGAAIVDSVSVTVNSPGVLNLINSETIGSLAGDGNTTLNASTLTLGGNNSSTTYNGVISGTGGLTKNGSGSMILNGINDFTGDTRIKAGQLVIGENDHSHASAQVGGDLYNDATLVGHGTIQGNVYNYGTLSPGYRTNMSGSGTLQERGLGTLQVMGDYQGENGFLDIQLDFQPGPGVIADQLTIAGTANLSGTTLRVTKSANELDYGDQFQIIDADTYVGQVDLFDISQFTNQMFFDNSTGIVYATGLTQQQTLADMEGLNTNQVNIAESLAAALVQEHGNSDFMDENLPLDAAVISIITDFDNSRTKINSLSPEAYAAFADYGIQVTRTYTRTAMNLSETPGQSGAAPAGIAGTKGGLATRQAPDVGNTSVFGGFSQYDISSTSSHNNADYDLTSTGGVMGFRHDVFDYSFGGFIGYDRGDVSSNYVNADVNGVLIGAFATHRLNDAHNCTFDGGVTHGDYRFDGCRQSTFGNTTFNGGDTSVFHVFTSMKGDLYKTEKLRFSPSFGLHYLNAETDSIAESGAGTALNVDGMRNEALLAEWDFNLEYKVVSNFLLTGSVGYTHNFVDAERDVSASFVAGGSPFNVTAPGLGNHILSTSIDASWQVNESLNIGTGYRAEFSSDSNVAGSVGFGASYRF